MDRSCFVVLVGFTVIYRNCMIIPMPNVLQLLISNIITIIIVSYFCINYTCKNKYCMNEYDHRRVSKHSPILHYSLIRRPAPKHWLSSLKDFLLENRFFFVYFQCLECTTSAQDCTMCLEVTKNIIHPVKILTGR